MAEHRRGSAYGPCSTVSKRPAVDSGSARAVVYAERVVGLGVGGRGGWIDAFRYLGGWGTERERRVAQR